VVKAISLENGKQTITKAYVVELQIYGKSGHEVPGQIFPSKHPIGVSC
jgi:hypothetical protein